jgi:mannose-6-phosphate isomerase-like protein (cupin superfamily)
MWSASAERSGDGALDLRPSIFTASKAVSRYACHRTPNWKCDMPAIRPIIGVIFFLPAVVICISAQSAQRKPSEATRPVVVMSAQSLDDLNRKLQPGNKTEELIDSAGMQLRVAVMRETNKTGVPAEVHDASDDVYYVLEGGATLVLGGRLDSPQEVEPGEWRSPRIIDGKTYEIRKGDLIVVPRGTPHQRNTPNKEFTMILIKIFAEPLKPGSPKPTPTSVPPSQKL